MNRFLGRFVVRAGLTILVLLVASCADDVRDSGGVAPSEATHETSPSLDGSAADAVQGDVRRNNQTVTVTGVAGQLLAQVAPSPVESWAEYWQRRLAGLPRIFTADQVQIPQFLAGDGQEQVIARFPIVIAPQTYAIDSPTRAHLDAIRAYNPDSILIAYQIPFEDVLPLNTGPGYDAMRYLRSIESAYMHDARGNRLYVTELSGTRGMFDPRSPDVRAAIKSAVAAILLAYPHDGIFFDNYGVKNAMLLDTKGNQYTGAPGQVWSEADYAAKLDAMTTLAEEVRAAWPGALIIANSANIFPAFNGELVEGSSQYYRMPVQAAELPGRVQPFIPLFQDTPVTGPDDPLIALRLAEVNAHGGWYGASVSNSRILWPSAFDNCTQMANPAQLDADGDGYGNICDADLNNSGWVTTDDYAIFRFELNQSASSSPAAAAADLNGNGRVDTTDYSILRAHFNGAPGPSGLHP